MKYPEDRLYSPAHVWLQQGGENYTAGITDFAQAELGDILYVDLPASGKHFKAGEEFGSIESVKTVSPLIMPADGEIAAINPDLREDPGLVNSSPYERGWMIKIKPDGAAVGGLLSADEYEKAIDMAR